MSKLVAWSVPAAVVALVGGGAVYSASASSVSPDLPEITAQELLASVAEAEAPALSGTLRTTSDLGLPELPEELAAGLAGEQTSGTDPKALLSRLLLGDATIRVWSDPEDERFRASLDDQDAELVLVRDGDAAWTYSSEDGTATRYDLAGLADGAELPEGGAPELPDATPQELAQQLLDAADPTTEVRVGETQQVAGQDAYTLLVDPRAEGTLVDRVEVAVDAATGVVLDVSVFAVDQPEPAFRSGFSRLSYEEPDASVFTFDPPEGATVEDAELPDGPLGEHGTSGSDVETPEPGDRAPQGTSFEGVKVLGEGWAGVIELDTAALSDDVAAGADAPAGTSVERPEGTAGAGDIDPQAVLEQLTTPVDGGRVLSTALLTVLLTDDGRVLVGSVDTGTLVAAAS